MPFAIFALLFVAASAELLARGNRVDVMIAIIDACVYALLSALAWRLTTQSAPEGYNGSRSPWAQIAICLGVILISGIGAAANDGALPHRIEIKSPVAPVHIAAAAGAPAWLQFGAGQFLVYAVVPALVLLPFGVRMSELGLRANWSVSLRVAIVWIAPMLALLVVGLVHGAYTPPALSAMLVRNLFSNGFSEEFLFRGALMTRLQLTMPPSWALFGQAALFSLWHYGADIRGSHGDLASAIGAMIVHQMLFGYAMGFIAMRARSILVPSLFHTLYDANPFFGIPR